MQHIAAVYNIHPAAEGGVRITPSLRDSLHRLLDSHTLFGGRDADLNRLNTFVEQRTSGYLFVTALSGYGKTALLANWVKMFQQDNRRVCYHFISRLHGKAAEEDFSLRNLCQQLTAYHDLRGTLPAATSELAALYPSLLEIPPAEGQKLIIVLDGLDEAKGWTPGADLFPLSLPAGVFVVFSAREIAERDWLATLNLPRSAVEVLELTPLGQAEIADLLRAGGGGASRWAEDGDFVSTMHKKSGGDPFYLHYLVKDIRDELVKSLTQLKNQPSELKGYLNRWWQEVSRAVSETAVSDLLGYLLVAQGRLTRDDLTNVSQEDALSGAVFERTIEQVQRYVVGDEKDGYTFCHPRFRDYVAQERIKEVEQLPYRKRLLEYCTRWSEHHSDYALQYFVAHLADARNHEALWKVLTEDNQDGRNVWYEAHVVAHDHQIDDTDRLPWYVKDVERAKEIFYSPDQPLPRSFGLALLGASVNSISERVPIELFGIMALLGESMVSHAITLARHKVNALNRARAFVRIVTNLADSSVLNDLITETVGLLAACPPQWALYTEINKLAPILSSEHARVVLDVVLHSPESPPAVEAVVTLASKLPDSEAAQVYSALWSAVHKVDDPINRAELLAVLSRLGLPQADEAAREAHEFIVADMRESDSQERAHRRLADAMVEVARCMAVPWDEIRQMLGRFEPDRQADILAQLLSEPVAVPVVPAVNHLLTLESSEARGKALAAAIDLLDEENIRRLAFGVHWDFKEFSWVAPHLSEPLRSDGARNLLEHMLKEAPQFHEQVEILARIVSYLSEADRERALGYMEACTQKVPLVPPEEEHGRQVKSMLYISDPSGKPVQFELHVSPARADTLSLLAQIAEGARKRDYIERSLRAAHAIGDPYEASLFLAELSKLCRDEESVRVQFAALDLAKNIEWEATRAEAMMKIAPFLDPQVTEAAIGVLGSFSEDKWRKDVEVQLLVNRPLLSDQDMERIFAALEDENEGWSVWLIERLADKVEQVQINGLVDRVLKWSDTAASQAIAAFAHRLSTERVLDLLTFRSWSLDVIECLLQSLDTSEQGKAVQWVYESVINHPNPAVRASVLGTLGQFEVSSLDQDELHKRLEEALEQINLRASPKEFAFVAKDLPTNSPYRTRLVAAALDGKGALDRLDHWGGIVHHLAGAAPPALLLDLLSSLEPLRVSDRTVGLRSLSEQIAEQLSADKQWDAWKEILRFTSRDPRRDLLAQLRSVLPLIKRLTPELLIASLADEVLRVQHSFP